MGAYLLDHKPVRDQWYDKRNRPLTGATVLHTSESAFDEIGADTGAEGVANYIRTRTTPGCYHDLVDSDSDIHLCPYQHGAYHDGTGSNNWALSLAFACRTTDWARMSPAKRAAVLRNGARAFARQQAWRRAHGAPLTELRRISKAQSDRGESGFVYHGDRDPARRSDPGTTAAAAFPFEEFLHWCRVELGGATPPPPKPAPGGGRPTIRRGDTGEHVWVLQRKLTTVYPSYNRYAPNGVFGPGTEAGVREFQQRSNLDVDGVVGPATWRALGL